MSQHKEQENLTKPNEKKKKTKKPKKTRRCCVCRKKNWTNMKCDCGKLCCIFHLKKELHTCTLEYINPKLEEIKKSTCISQKISVI